MFEDLMRFQCSFVTWELCRLQCFRLQLTPERPVQLAMKPEESSTARRGVNLKHDPLLYSLSILFPFMHDLLQTFNLILIQPFIHQSVTAKDLDSLRLTI